MSHPSPGKLCPICGKGVDPSWSLCPECGTILDPAATRTIASVAPSSSSSVEEGRFPAGTVLAGRYKVLALIGRGGMGEVYRAYDLILNQQVALKFLIGTRVGEAALARFRNEVRVARQVSHPNVCRVYDLGVVEGLNFLSMEYIDGEDLASLLRRIGRLPQDKAIEFTRKICAGLGAAHERGVLHRDLKPANVMIDARGHVRITDFGLAALAQEIALGDIRSGTPAYMAPEQKEGREVTTRSDLYSLGLVLYEMFTGKRRAESESNPSEHVKDLDPAIERVILRCLEDDPKRRPSSALQVSMALPGGDPIAAALAAGETPSPEMVAASQEREGLDPRLAIACFTATVVLLSVLSYATGRIGLLSRTPLPLPPEALAFRSQQILRQLGYTEQAQDSAFGFDCCDADYLRFLSGVDTGQRDRLLATHQPAVVRFWYRQHRSQFKPDAFFLGSSLPPVVPLNGAITYASPANIEPGMIRMALDATGRLVALEARPVGRGAAGDAVDWMPLFSAAGLDPARFTSATPAEIPPMAFDGRAAWIGSYASDRQEKIRVEAASWQGAPVFFSMKGDWPQREDPSLVPSAAFTVMFVLGLGLLAGGAMLAKRNLALGRGDRRGAAVLAAFAFSAVLLHWILIAHHSSTAWELNLFVKAMCFACFDGVAVWIAYLAVEPYARRYWPEALISWTRLQTGRFRDPVVASHVLVGILVSIAMTSLDLALVWGFDRGRPLFLPRIDVLGSPALAAAYLSFDTMRGASGGLAVFVLMILVRLAVRRIWLAEVVGAAIIGTALAGLGGWVHHQYVVHLLSQVLLTYVLMNVLRRFGLLALWVAIAGSFYMLTPLAVTSWYAMRSAVLLAVLAAAAGWALWVILSAQNRPSMQSA